MFRAKISTQSFTQQQHEICFIVTGSGILAIIWRLLFQFLEQNCLLLWPAGGAPIGVDKQLHWPEMFSFFDGKRGTQVSQVNIASCRAQIYYAWCFIGPIIASLDGNWWTIIFSINGQLETTLTKLKITGLFFNELDSFAHRWIALKRVYRTSFESNSTRWSGRLLIGGKVAGGSQVWSKYPESKNFNYN